uniref:Uncharacterized protein n=1 Tax=Microcebus murinus TaxID=30608 RepID=A0A8C5YDJ2_MICMU
VEKLASGQLHSPCSSSPLSPSAPAHAHTQPSLQTRLQARPSSTNLLRRRAWVTPGSCTGHWCYLAQLPAGFASRGECY